MDRVYRKFINMLELDAHCIGELLLLQASIELFIKNFPNCLEKTMNEKCVNATHVYFMKYDKNIVKSSLRKYNKTVHGLFIIAHTLVLITNTKSLDSERYWYHEYVNENGYVYSLTHLVSLVLKSNVSCRPKSQILFVESVNNAIFSFDNVESIVSSVDMDVLEYIKTFLIDVVYACYVMSGNNMNKRILYVKRIKRLAFVQDYQPFFTELCSMETMINYTPYWNRNETYLRNKPMPSTLYMPIHDIVEYAKTMYLQNK